MNNRIDRTDRKILSLLQENARTPLKYLAQKVFLSSPAVSSRIAKLEDKGVIHSYQAVLDPDLLGYHIQAFVTLKLERHDENEFFDFAENCKHITECHQITGANSIIMKVIFTETKDLNAFLHTISAFGKTETQIIVASPIAGRGLPQLDSDYIDDLAV